MPRYQDLTDEANETLPGRWEPNASTSRRTGQAKPSANKGRSGEGSTTDGSITGKELTTAKEQGLHDHGVAIELRMARVES